MYFHFIGLDQDDLDKIEKTSSVDVNAVDNQGWSVIHHLVCSLEYGSYDNNKLLYTLWASGADIRIKDKTGLTPLDYATKKGAVKLSKRLQRLDHVADSDVVCFMLFSLIIFYIGLKTTFHLYFNYSGTSLIRTPSFPD